MALKRELSQSSIGAAPPCKTPRLAPPLLTPRLAPPRPTSRLALTVLTPSSPDPISMASTVVSPSNDDRIPSPSRSSRLTSVPSLSVNSLKKLDSTQLVARLEELAEEYERSVDEMGAEIDHLRCEVSFARRRLEVTPSLEESDMAAHRASGPGLERGVVLGTLRSTNHTIEGDGGSVGDLEDERSVEPSAQDESSGSAVEVNGARVGDAQHKRGVEATMQDGAESSSHNHTTA